MFTPIWEMPYAEDLVEKWGEPRESRLSWWNLMPGLLIPPIHPMYRWYWYMEDKKVDVLIDRPIIYGFSPHVFTLEILVNDENGS